MTLAGQDTLLIAESNVFNPVWSPASTKIAFESGWGDIDTINVNGTGRARIIKRSSSSGPNAFFVGGPVWSPTGSHIMYMQWGTYTYRLDLYRATFSGGSKTNLTGDLPSGVSGSIGWR